MTVVLKDHPFPWIEVCTHLLRNKNRVDCLYPCVLDTIKSHVHNHCTYNVCKNSCRKLISRMDVFLFRFNVQWSGYKWCNSSFRHAWEESFSHRIEIGWKQHTLSASGTNSAEMQAREFLIWEPHAIVNLNVGFQLFLKQNRQNEPHRPEYREDQPLKIPTRSFRMS